MIKMNFKDGHKIKQDVLQQLALTIFYNGDNFL